MLYYVLDKKTFPTTSEYLTHLIAEERRELDKVESFAATHRARVAQLEEALRAISPPVVFQQADNCDNELKPESDNDPIKETIELEVDDSPARRHIARFCRDLTEALKPLTQLAEQRLC